MQSSLRARRSPTVRRIAAVRALACALWLAAAPAAAEDRSEADLARWVPGLAFSYDMLQHKAHGDITTSNVLGPPQPPYFPGGCTERTPFNTPFQTGGLCTNSPLQIAPPTTGGDTDIGALVNASLELATPRLIDSFLSPRLFAHVDVAIAFGFERTLAGERKPGVFSVEPLQPNVAEYSEGQIDGQGSRAKIQLRSVVAGAGGGVAFTTDVFGHTLRLKPSVEYLYEQVDLIGAVHRAVKLSRFPRFPRALSDFRLITLTEESTEDLHGVGGGLEVEMDAGRLGPVMMSIFASGRAYYFLGNLRHTFYAENEFGENATWNFALDPWSYRGAVGARFRWLPE